MFIGIDLGTTNSLVATLRDSQPVALPNVHGSVLTPSVVSIDSDGAVLVGATARERLVTHPERSIGSFKRLMGTSRNLRLGDRSFRPEELSALVLRTLKSDAELVLGTTVEDVVVSVPAYFNDQQREATRVAGELAGLNVLRLVNEPTAAALCHGIDDREGDSSFLVVDLGGGTFDVSVLERFDGVMEVRATGGDSFLGGDDFTKLLVELLAAKASIGPQRDADRVLAAALWRAAESAKRQLGMQTRCDVDLRAAGHGLVALTLDEFEHAAQRLLDRLRAPIERALRDARLRAADLDEVVLVGGASRMASVRRVVSQLFGRLPARHPDPDQTIALGAAVCAGLIGRAAGFREIVMTDVCPHSLGTQVVEADDRGTVTGGVFLPIIERNTVVPASRVRRVTTGRDGQNRISVAVFQGESRHCSHNIRLGEIELDIPPLPAGAVNIDVRYTYDADGVVDVDVTVPDHGIAGNLVIGKLKGTIGDDEIARRRVALASLKVHPRDQEENRLQLARANRLFESLLGEERAAVGRWLGQFEAVLERQDPHAVALARKSLAAALDGVESGPRW